MTLEDDGGVLFYPLTLRLRPGGSPPVELMHAREVHLRGWRRAEVEEVLAAAGFQHLEAFGDFDGAPWQESSRDLVLVAR
jgi:hypothetical protein